MPSKVIREHYLSCFIVAAIAALWVACGYAAFRIGWSELQERHPWAAAPSQRRAELARALFFGPITFLAWPKQRALAAVLTCGVALFFGDCTIGDWFVDFVLSVW